MLALWLGGLGCLSGCALMGSTALAAAPEAIVSAQPPDVPTVSVSADGDHACCRLMKEEAAPKSATQQRLFGHASRAPRTMDCCPLARLASDPARKPRVATEQFADLAQTSAIFKADPQTFFTPLPLRVWRPPRTETYLLCCVFLI